ncbi:MAG: hypothetical protein ABF562_02700 [Gluconobacter japonicus]|uniref:hypothetical protein n=1 Tax=Gluconobacter japonicus TaxID=376620 RepID=UPI0039EC1515
MPTAERPVARSEQRITAKADALINDAARLELVGSHHGRKFWEWLLSVIVAP